MDFTPILLPLKIRRAAAVVAHTLQYNMASVCRFASAAFRADTVYNTRITADRVAVDRVIYRAVADTVIVHTADDGFKRRQIFRRVAVHFNIADMTAVRQIVIRCFQLDFALSADWIINRNME